MSQVWWTQVNGPALAQGDLLPDCLLPVFTGPELGTEQSPARESVHPQRLIVVTQTCDLVNDKVIFVALCPIHTLIEFEETNPEFRARGRWENVRKGRVEGLHLLASPETPGDNRKALVVDFGHIVSLPVGYLSSHAAERGDRWRLESPFLEHFSQSFARLFMRVGLPSAIPEYR